MENNLATEIFLETVNKSSDVMMYTITATFIASQFIQGSMNFMLAFINQLQMIIHIPLLAVPLPANVMAFFEFLIPVV